MLVAQFSQAPDTKQNQDIFWDLIILLDLPYDSQENEVMFVKNGNKVPELRLDISSGTKQVTQM